MQFVGPILVPEVTAPLLAILGLLVIWQYYQHQILVSRIYSLDYGIMFGIRMLMHATTRDGSACGTCQEANLTAFLPSVATTKNFSTLRHPCSSPRGCRCMVVGLRGRWSEANHLVETLRRHSKHKPMKLRDEEVRKLFEGSWCGSIRDAADRVTIHMVQALHLEGSDPQASISQYRYVVDQARGVRDLRLVVPAYLRLAELLQRVGRFSEALEVIEEFERRFSWRRAVFYYPTDAQREEMSIRKSHLPGGGGKAQPSAPSLKLQGRAKRAMFSS